MVTRDPRREVGSEPARLSASAPHVEAVGGAVQVVVPVDVVPASDAGLLVLGVPAVAGLVDPNADDVVPGAVHAAVDGHSGRLCRSSRCRACERDGDCCHRAHQGLLEAIHFSP